MSTDAAPRTARKRKKTRWAIVAVIAVVVVAAALVLPLVLRPKASAGSANKTEAVARGAIVVTVSGDGDVVSATTADVYPEISGTIEKVYVAEGDRVKKGDVLYTISDDNLKASLLQAEASMRQAQQSKLQAAQTEDQANASLQQAQLSLMQAEQSLDQAENSTMTSGSQLKIAKKQVKSAKAQIKSAEAGIDTADAAIRTANANVESANNSYDEAKQQYDYTTVEAPMTGIVTTLNVVKGGSASGGSASVSAASMTSAGTGSASGASSAGGSSASCVISNEKSLKVRVQVNEVDAPKLKVGQKASITFDSLPNVAPTGTVTWIAATGTNTGGVVTYDVDIKLPGAPKGVKLGMTATADILTRESTGVITVQNTSVKVDRVQKYVNVQRPGGSVEKIVVTVGAATDKRTEITSGLKAGDLVVLGTPVARPRAGGFMAGMRRGN